MSLPAKWTLLKEIWNQGRNCRGCSHFHSERGQDYCTALPPECPEILDQISREIEINFDPDEIRWLTKYNIEDPEGLNLSAFAREFYYDSSTAYDQVILWKALNLLKKELS